MRFIGAPFDLPAGIQTLDGHSNNVCSVLFHPQLPVLVSASEDGTVRIWHAMTYRAETTLNYGLERAWSISAAKESNGLAIGYDEGTILIKLGHDAPVASLDTHISCHLQAGSQIRVTDLGILEKWCGHITMIFNLHH